MDVEHSQENQHRKKFRKLVHTSLECGLSKKTTLKLVKIMLDEDHDECPTTWKQLLSSAG